MRQAGTYSGIRFRGGNGAHSLPLARIKKIMKRSGSGDEVKMISGEAPIVFAKACELFIKEVTQKSWTLTLQGKRRILQKDDVAVFDFLVGLVSDDDHLHQCHADNIIVTEERETVLEE